MKHLENILNNIIQERTFNTIFKDKDKWVELSDNEKKELSGNLWKLVSNAYDTRFEGGHPRISNAQDVVKDMDLKFWKAADIDKDPFADVVIFGRPTSFGIKISGIGHSNDMRTKKEVMKQSAKVLRQNGFWIEVSGGPAKILLGAYKVPTVDNKEDAEKVLGYKITEWLGEDPEGLPGNGWYIRDVSNGNLLKKCILGRPTI